MKIGDVKSKPGGRVESENWGDDHGTSHRNLPQLDRGGITKKKGRSEYEKKYNGVKANRWKAEEDRKGRKKAE